MFDVTDNADEVRRAVAEAERAISDGMRRGVAMAVSEGAEEARQHIHSVTGELAEKTTGRVEVSTPGGASGVIESKARHASFVEEGTAAHEIRPKLGGDFIGPERPGQGRRARGRSLLRWESGGDVHFARVVHHPGTGPHPFMGPAHQKAERVLVRETELGVAKAQEILER